MKQGTLSVSECLLKSLRNKLLFSFSFPLTKTTEPQIGTAINSIFDLESAKPKNSLKCICDETKAKQREKVAESTVP